VQRRTVAIIASVLVIAMTAGACSRQADTTAVDATDIPAGQSAPTSTIMRADDSDVEDTTTTAPVGRPASAATDPTAILTQLLGQFAADPTLAAQLAQLDAVGIANLLGIDLTALQALELTPAQLTQLAQGVAVSAPPVQQELVSGAPDPAVLLGLLAGSLDLQSLADGTIATVVQGLLAAVTGLRIVVSPELTVDLGELLAELDPEGLGPLAANPANAALLALITSAWLGSNPLLAQQLLSNPQLDPALRDLLEQLDQLSGSIGDTAREALLAALFALIPALDPNR
jgi:hypothetical protein